MFDYIIKKIENADFVDFPFKHLYIEDFLSKDHFDLLKKDKQISFNEFNSTIELMQELKNKKYTVTKFPGCVTSESVYLKAEETGIFETPAPDRLESFGMAYRLQSYDSSFTKELIDFLNSDNFHDTLKDKFGLDRPTKIHTSIQKYLNKYEISPHPDIKSKALTYLININTKENSEDLDIHTHLLKFKKEYDFIPNVWKEKENRDRDWVPWDWCTTEKYVSKNNSLVMFSPDNDTLHAVKLNYNHNKVQRTQLYGNLWFTDKKKALKKIYYLDLLDYKN